MTLSITAKGYDSPAPNVYSHMIAGLAQRSSPLTVLSLDNVAGNGSNFRRKLLDYVEREGKGDNNTLLSGFRDWVEGNLFTPNTIVDRITPRREGLTVRTEAHHQFIVEGRHLPGLELFKGVKIVDNIRPYWSAKMMRVNGCHVIVALYGLLHKLTHVHEVMEDAAGRSLVEMCHSEYVAILKGTQGASGAKEIADCDFGDISDRLSNGTMQDTDGLISLNCPKQR